jgi:hypothetical protein
MADLFTELVLQPPGLLDGQGDELGADVALTELVFVHLFLRFLVRRICLSKEVKSH